MVTVRRNSCLGCSMSPSSLKPHPRIRLRTRPWEQSALQGLDSCYQDGGQGKEKLRRFSLVICKIISYARTIRFTMQSLVMGKTVITQGRRNCQPFCSQRLPTWSSRPNLNIPWLDLSIAIGEGSGTPLQYSCLENPWTEEPGRLQSMGSLRVTGAFGLGRAQPQRRGTSP